MSDAKVVISAIDATKAAFASVSRNFDSLQGKLSGLGLALPVLSVGASAGALAALTLEASKAIDEFNDLKDATGASIENISALDRIARETGSDFDTVASSLIKFNKTLNDSGTDGSRAAEILKSLGLNAAELKKQDPAEAMRQLAVAFSTFADDGARGRAILELTGKSALKMAPLLNDLAEKGKLVASTTTQQAAEADKFNKELFAMQANVQDLSRDFANKLIPVMNQVFKDFHTFGDKATLAGAAGDVIRLKNELDGLKENKGGIYDIFGGVSKQIAAATREFEAAQAKFKSLDVKGSGSDASYDSLEGKRLGKRSLKVEDPKKTGGGGSKKDPLAEAKRYLESLQKQVDKTQNLTAAEQALAEIQSGRLGSVPAGMQGQMLAYAKQLDADKELIELLKFKRDAAIEAGDAINKSNEEYQALLGRLLDATPSANLEKERKDVKLLTDEFEAGRLSETLYLEAVTARLDLVADKTGQAKTAAEEYGMTMASAFEDAIVSGKDLGDVLEGLIDDMARMALRKSVTEPMGSFISSAISSFMSFDGGGYTGGGSRSGGLDGKGGFMAMMHPQESVFDHTKGQQSGGSSVVVNVIESPGNGGQQNRRTENGVDIFDIMVEKLESRIAGGIARGDGMVSNTMTRTFGLNRVAGAY